MNVFTVAFSAHFSAHDSVGKIRAIVDGVLGSDVSCAVLDLEAGDRLVERCGMSELSVLASQYAAWNAILDSSLMHGILGEAQALVRRDISGSWIPSCIYLSAADHREGWTLWRDGEWVRELEWLPVHPVLELGLWGYGGPQVTVPEDFIVIAKKLLELPFMAQLCDGFCGRLQRTSLLVSYA